jgi:hypothetical protein
VNKKATYYMHLVNGHPASFLKKGRVLYNCFGRERVILVPTLAQIREEQDADKRSHTFTFDIERNYGHLLVTCESNES